MSNEVIIPNVTMPIGTSIIFQGSEIGKVIDTIDDGITCGIICDITDDVVRSWIDCSKVGFSLEVSKWLNVVIDLMI